MRYTKGVRGPQSQHDMTISHILTDDPIRKITHLLVEARLKSGTRTIKLMLQGRHHDAVRSVLSVGSRFRAEIRWTASLAATATKIIDANLERAA